jgi:hypothetical protein
MGSCFLSAGLRLFVISTRAPPFRFEHRVSLGKAIPIPQPYATAGTQVALVVPFEAYLQVSQTLLVLARKMSRRYPVSVNPFVPVNRESSRDSAILYGVESRKRAILDVELAGRDERFGAAVNKKPAKTTDLNEKSRGRDLGFLR